MAAARRPHPTLFNSPGKRRVVVEQWQDSRRAEKARHAEPVLIPAQQGPRSLAARRELDQAFAAIRARITPAFEDVVEDQEQRGLEDLTPEEITSMRVDAMRDPGLIFAAIEIGGETYARRLYTSRLVDQTLALQAINTRNTVLTPAF